LAGPLGRGQPAVLAGRHPRLAPPVSPNWRIVGTYLAIGCAAALLGGWHFTRRDLQSG
jgi:hypothetical protein